MTSHDLRVDAYIARSAAFPHPILENIRSVVHAACPEVEEGVKWSMQFFSYKGAPMCMMASFKQHASFGFWLSRDVMVGSDEGGMGQFGKLASLADLPSKKQLVTYLKKAMALNEASVKKARPTAAAKPAPALADDLAALLAQKKHAAARKSWAGFSPGAQREYVEWIVEAKTEANRQKRLATTLEWMAEDKPRNRKYQQC